MLDYGSILKAKSVGFLSILDMKKCKTMPVLFGLNKLEHVIDMGESRVVGVSSGEKTGSFGLARDISK